MVLEFARPLEAWCFPAGGDFFEAVSCYQPQATESVEKSTESENKPKICNIT